jgi:hypothetical protein
MLKEGEDWAVPVTGNGGMHGGLSGFLDELALQIIGSKCLVASVYSVQYRLIGD